MQLLLLSMGQVHTSAHGHLTYVPLWSPFLPGFPQPVLTPLHPRATSPCLPAVWHFHIHLRVHLLLVITPWRPVTLLRGWASACSQCPVMHVVQALMHCPPRVLT
jgi:hypothetical protein